MSKDNPNTPTPSQTQGSVPQTNKPSGALSFTKWLVSTIGQIYVGNLWPKLGGTLVAGAISYAQAVFAHDGGVPWWIAIMYAVITFAILTALVLVIFSRRKPPAQQAIAAAPPPQQVMQTVNANPTLNANPVTNVYVGGETGVPAERERRRGGREYVTPPVFERAGARIIKRVIDGRDNTFIEDEFFGKESDLQEYQRLVDVALAKIRYRADVGVPPSLDVMAHIHFRVPAEGRECDIDYGVWWPDRLSRSQTFNAGDRHALIIGFVLPERRDFCATYEHHTKPHEFPATTYEYLAPIITQLDGTEFLIRVDLTLKRMSEVVGTKSFEYRLTLAPELRFEEVSDVRGLTEQPAKGAGVAETIRQLNELAEEGNQLLMVGKGVDVDWISAKEWAARVEEYIKERVSEKDAAYIALSVTKPYPGLAVNREFVNFVHTKIDRIGEIAAELRRR